MLEAETGAIRRCRTSRIEKKSRPPTHVVLHTCEQTSRRVWWPLSCRPDKKFSFKTAGPETTLCPGTEGAPFRPRGHAQWRGACVSWCVPYLHTATASDYETRETLCSFSPLCRVHPSGYWRGQAHDALWSPSSDPSQSGRRMTILLWKKRNARVDRTPFSREGRGETPRNWNGLVLVACPEMFAVPAKRSMDLEGGRWVREEGGNPRIHGTIQGCVRWCWNRAKSTFKVVPRLFSRCVRFKTLC